MAKRKNTQSHHEGETDVVETQDASEQEVKVVDKRRFARLLGFGPDTTGAVEADSVEAPVEERHFPSFVEELRQRAELAEATAKAEVEAARARLERHYEARLASARAELVADMLEVLDNLDRALEAPGAADSSLFEGISATRAIFAKKLAELGLEPVEAVGVPFDPEVHEAIDEVPVDDPELDGRVIEQYQSGYRLGDRLVRPARVRVARFS